MITIPRFRFHMTFTTTHIIVIHIKATGDGGVGVIHPQQEVLLMYIIS